MVNENNFKLKLDKSLQNKQDQKDFLINQINQKRDSKPGRKSNKWREMRKQQLNQLKLLQETEKEENKGKMSVEILDVLISPLRSDHEFEKWSPKEVAIFESAICRYGPEFSFIQHLIQTKTINEVNNFYHEWTRTSHFKIWHLSKNSVSQQNFNNWL